MKRALRPEELNLWARIAATIHPAPGRHAPTATSPESAAEAAALPPRLPHPPKPAPPRTHVRRPAPPETIEPGRMRRLTRERDPLGPRLDLHGLDQDQARAVLTSFLHRAQEDGWRAVLIITRSEERRVGKECW